MAEILLVEDEDSVRRVVREAFERRGLSVHEVSTAADARQALKEQPFRVVILDLTLPDGSGLALLEGLELGPSRPHVIILSGSTSEIQRIEGLDGGADDYVTKPFFARELVARVLAVIRRRESEQPTDLEVGGIRMSVVQRTASIDGVELELTAKEFDLLAFLAARPGHVFTREELLHRVWDSSSEWQRSTTVTEHIRRLRAKVEVDQRHPVVLCTIRGVGYRLVPPVARPVQRDDSAPGVVIHAGGRIVSVDVTAAALLGYTDTAGLMGKHLVELVAPASADHARRQLCETEAGAVRRSELLHLLRSDGRSVQLEVASSTVMWDGERAGRVELRPAAVSSNLIRHLATGVAAEVLDAVIVADLDMHIRSWNLGAERLYGWTEDEVRGRHLLDVLDWQLDDGELQSAWGNIETSDRWHDEVRQITREGSVLTVLASVTLARDDEGSPFAVVSVNRPCPTSNAEDARPVRAEEVEDLRRGLEQGEFEVHYQPVVDMNDRSVITVEALVRWRHPDRGLLMPSAFIHLAERSDVIVALGEFVLRAACEQVVRWRATGSGVSLAVNLSTRELADPGLVTRVSSVLLESGLPATALWLEITETALVHDVAEARATLHRLATMGIGLSIDDFGTGWASLTYLREFPVHVLKIDQVFVAGVDRSPHDLAIVRSVIALGAELDLLVVAEGVETVDQAAVLLDLGCSIGQGFLYGRPTPGHEIPLSSLGCTAASRAS